ncbi:amidophosphoribosyltransferase [Microbispora corallina]|uniref:Phosphoribosyltransferase domain-containing protein n=1 Tax=Microbispora corallina TaxID=83302 RepID=A0ABQ4G979_9ACTN|nr:hypothetical protein [Microbispora corallina]GIH43597.1 hypothetical protein Mco01_65970 [Microbispora corallina]
MLAAMLDLVLPPRCAGCGEPGSVTCRVCATGLSRDPEPRPPHPPPDGLPECWSGTTYEGAARRVILAYKERGRTSLAPFLGACLAATALAALRSPGGPSGPGVPVAAGIAGAIGGARRPGPIAGPALRPLEPSGPVARAGSFGPVVPFRAAGPVVLVPVPSARAATRRRGHDPVRALATVAARELSGRGVPAVAVPLLRQARRVADQAGLSAAQRAANLSGAFQAAPGVAALHAPPHARAEAAVGGRGGEPVVVLVDDVVTTGTTLAEAARAITAAGVPVPLAITVAATPRRAATRRGVGRANHYAA